VLFVANAWGYWKDNRERAYLFTSLLHAGPAVEGAAGTFWFLPVLGFVAAAQGIVRHAAWWESLTLRTAAGSIAMLVLWWGGLSISSSIAALAFDLAVIAGLLWRGHAGLLHS